MPVHVPPSIVIITHLERTQKQFLVQLFRDLHLMFVDIEEARNASRYFCDFLIVHDTELSTHSLSLRNQADTVIYVPPVAGGNRLQSLANALTSLSNSLKAADPVMPRGSHLSGLDALQIALGDIAQGLLKASSWKDYIERALKELGLATGVDRVYLFENVEQGGELLFYQRYEWVPSHIEPQINNPDLQGGKYSDGQERWLEELSSGHPIVGDVETFPDSELAILDAQGIISICVMPILVDGRFWGVIGFDSVLKKRVWTPLELETLRLVSNVLAAAIQYERTARKLEKTEDELNSILNRVDDVIYAIEPGQAHVIYANPALEKLTGYPLQHFYQTPNFWTSIIHHKDQTTVGSAYQQLLQQRNDHITLQYRIVRKDGQVRWVEDRSYVVYQNSRPVQINGLVVDITMVKAAQQRAEQLTLRLNAVLDNIKSAILLVEADGKIIHVNHAFQNNLLMDSPDTFGEILDLLARISVDPDELRHHALSAMQEQRVHKQHELTLRDGRIISCDYSPIVHEDRVEHLWHCRDVTAYKQTLRDLQVALEQEIQLNKLRNDFVSIVSHEFRTPLSIINSSNETLLRYNDRLSQEQKAQRHLRIETQVRHMTAMLDDALLMGKMESSFKFVPQRTDLSQLIEEIVTDFRQTFPEYHIVVDNHQRSCEAEVDPKMFRQIAHNLLSNAIKYSEEGSQVKVELTTDHEYAVLAVTDQGIGIPSSEHDRMFQLFKRGSNVQDIPGSGLGLVIVHNAVKRHNGSISFESEINRGTRFIVRLPVQQPVAVKADTEVRQ
jgi:PAS domain S-box-containing protein